MTSITIDMLAMRLDMLDKQIALIESRENEPKAKTNGKSKKEENKLKTKRVPSGYNLFSKANRDAAKELIIKENELEEGEKPKNQEVMAKMGSMWRDLSEEEKNEWKDKSNSLKEELDIEVEVDEV